MNRALDGVSRRYSPSMKRSFAAVVVILMALSACSSDDESPDDPETVQDDVSELESATEEQAETREEALSQLDQTILLEAAVVSYTYAFLSGDEDAAWGLLSERCRDRTPEDQFRAAVREAGAIYGPLEFRRLEVAVNGDQGQATYVFEATELNQDREPWVREDGEWYNDGC